MRVTAADLWEPAPGRVLTWQVTGGGPGREVPLSLNQRNHLAAAAAGEPAVWLAVSFEVDGPIDAGAAQRAFAALVARHGVLQTEAVSPTYAVRRERASFAWSPGLDRETTDVASTRELLAGLFDEGCRSWGYPGFVPAAISRPDRSQLVIGMDHFYTDAFSLSVIVDDLGRLYDEERGIPGPDLPPASCFVAGARAESEDPVRMWPDDERLRYWHDFLAHSGHRMPSFPIDLGVAPGERHAQATYVGALADAATTERLARPPATTSAVVLSALAGAIGDLGGPAELDILMPMHTRSGPRELRAVGWYTTTVPVTLGADVTATSLALRAARRAREVPLEQVFASLSAPLTQERRDVFMASYLDYRRLPGHAHSAVRRPEHISSPTLADDLQLWVSRTDAGLGLRVRYPATGTAQRVVGDLVAAWSARLARCVLGEGADNPGGAEAEPRTGVVGRA
ncbi:MAG: condensation domain-containing protein [Nocardioidaceae bacterium]|nr:condensation domain-containing protein [Nocardioidaceae bacterium]MCL2611877.1 condensation domain-containing protein [Nocardioidaceae bacterium]